MIKSFKNCESKKTFLKFRHLRNFRYSDPLEALFAIRFTTLLVTPTFLTLILWRNKIFFRVITKTNTIFNRQMIFLRYQIQILITLQKISSLTRYYNRLAKHFPLHYCIYIISINKYSKSILNLFGQGYWVSDYY